VFRKSDLKANASFAIVYQAVKTTTAILSLPNVVEAASTIVSKYRQVLYCDTSVKITFFFFNLDLLPLKIKI
jgi:hypothetical protein